ncbi:DNA-directed DNA polymerase [Tanacetum coccineum]
MLTLKTLDFAWTNPSSEQDNVVTDEVNMGDDGTEFDTADENLFDTESEIKFVKSYKPVTYNEESLFTSKESDTEEDSELASIPDDEIGSPSTFQTSNTEESLTKPKLSKSEENDADNVLDELADLRASTNKPSESIILITEALKQELLGLLTDALKSTLPVLLKDFIKESVDTCVEEKLPIFNEELSKVIQQQIGKKVKTKVRTGMNKVTKGLDTIVNSVKDNSDNISELKQQMTELVSLLHSAEGEQQDNTANQTSIEELNGTMVIHSSELKGLEEKTVARSVSDDEDDEPIAKRLKVLIPTPKPLQSIIPNPPRDERKGKGIATEEEPLKQLMMYLKRLADQKAAKEKTKKSLQKIKIEAQKAQLAEYEAKRAKMLADYNHHIHFRAYLGRITKINYKIDKVSRDATMRIERDNQSLSLTVMEKFGLKQLGFMEWIEVHALASKGKRKASNTLLRHLTIIINLMQVEDLQLGVKSYQKKLNLTKPDTFRSNLRNKTEYTSHSDPYGIIYVDQFKRKRLMRADELHKFSDGTVNDVRTALHDIDVGIRMEYMPMRKLSNLDKKRARVMVHDIDKQLYQRRLMWNLELFVGGRIYEKDLIFLSQQISGIETRLCPYHFNYPERSLTMEELLNNFIDEGKREHEEMRAFIYDVRTNNKLLFKERNNSLIELRFGVQELLNVINNVQMIDGDVKGVTTRVGKTTTQDVHDNDTNVLQKDPVEVEPEKLARSDEVLTNDQPQITRKPIVQTSNEVQPPLVPFPKRLRKEKDEAQQKKFLENLKQLHINLPFIRALAQMPKYAKFLKGLLTNKAILEEACKIIMNEKCSAILLNKLLSKEKDLGSFTIPYDIGQLHINNALADLGASISLMPYTMYKKLGLGEPKTTRMSLELADRSIQYPRGITENVLIKVDKFVLPIDFVILDMPEDSRVPIILGRPFLATARSMIDVFNKKITLRVGDDEVVFDVDQSIKRPTTEDDECYGIDDLDKMINEEAQELLKKEERDSFLSKGLEKSIDQSDLECYESTSINEKNRSESEQSIWRINSVNTPYPITIGDNVKSEHLYFASANEIDEKKPELKNLPQHLEYAYLHGYKSFQVIILSKLSENEKNITSTSIRETKRSDCLENVEYQRNQPIILYAQGFNRR